MIKIAISGAAGRMGKTVIKLASRMSEITIAGALEKKGHQFIGKDICEIVEFPQPLNVRLTSDINEISADVLIDFALKDAIAEHVTYASCKKMPVVIGTTGLNEETLNLIKKCSQSIPVVLSPNMSTGINILFDTVKRIASTTGNSYYVEIEETHHMHKKDAPSGTALKLAEIIASIKNIPFPECIEHDADGKSKIKNPRKIVIKSYREGDTIGIHLIKFANEYEEIVISHKAITREAFAAGAIKAAIWVIHQKNGLYSMQDVLGLSS